MDESVERPNCSRCGKPAVLHQRYSGLNLCGKHLIESIRKRVSKELRRQLLPSKRANSGEPLVILVAISGGKDSAVLLDVLSHILSPRRDVTLVAGLVDEGLTGYRDVTAKDAQGVAEKLGVPFEVVKFSELDFLSLDDIMELHPGLADEFPESEGLQACGYCGVFRRQGLNQLAERVGATHLALGHNLDDMAQSVLMNYQRGDLSRTIRLAPHTSDELEGFVPRVVPLRWIPEQELAAYAILAGLPHSSIECPHADGAYRSAPRDAVALLESATPGARHGLVRSADEMKKLWRDAKTNRGDGLDDEGNRWTVNPPKECESCGEVTSQLLCKACEMRSWVKGYSSITTGHSPPAGTGEMRSQVKDFSLRKKE